MAVRNPPNSDFQYTSQFQVTGEMKNAFDINGYIIVRGLFDKKEVDKLRAALEHPSGVMAKHYIGEEQSGGARLEMTVWNQPGNDVTGMVARCEKMAGTFEQLLAGEVYHYHSKVIMKRAEIGGAFNWHQDYGYWYGNGLVFPHMGTVMIAVDKADRGNGCLQVLQGSQRAGRINHFKQGDQAIADDERLKQLEKFCPLIHVELEAGDALFFHCNVLHRSDINTSDRRRCALLVAYNRADNDPVYKHHHPQYTPLQKVPNSAVAECTVVTDMSGKDFFTEINSESHLALNNMAEKPT